MNGHELVSGWYSLAIDTGAPTIFRLKQRATGKTPVLPDNRIRLSRDRAPIM
jgi:hypothetical protein